MKKTALLLLSILLGTFFVWSTYVKIESIDIYEISLVKQGLSSWNMSRFISRIFLAVEFTIGLLLIFQYRLKRITLPVTIGFIIFLTLFLVGRLFFIGNEADCGCFGDAINFSTLESIGKNMILFLVSFALFKSNDIFEFQKWNFKKVLAISFILVLTSIIIYQPPINIYEEFSIDNFKKGEAFPDIEDLPNEVYNGKSIVAFLSPNCVHCKHAAIKLKVLSDMDSHYNIYPVFGFGKSDIESFMDDVDLQTPYIIIPKKPFLQMTQGSFPQIYVLEESKIKMILNKREFLEENF